MINIIDLIRVFTEENRNYNNSANFSWHKQHQQIYVRYDEFLKKSNTLHETETATNTETSNYS